MKKETKIIIAVIAIVVIVLVAVMLVKNNKKDDKTVTNQEAASIGKVESAEDLSKVIDKVYEGQKNLLSSLTTTTIDVTDKDAVKSIVGLENGDDLEYLVASEPMMSSQAYSFALAKVKSGVKADDVAKKISENVNPAKWLCVSAEKVYTTSSGDIVCLVMTSEEIGKPIYDSFKKIAGTVGEEYEKTVEESGDFLEQVY